MQERFGIPYSRTGQPYGPEATREWLLGVATPLGMEEKALEVIEREMQEVEPDLAYLKQALSGKTAIIEISEFPGPIRALSLARMAEEFGARPVVINVHPYTIKERMPSIKFILGDGINPEIILTKGLFRLGSFRSSKETEDELEAIVREYDNAIFFGNSGRFPPCPVVNLSLMNPAFQPQYGFRGIKNIAALVRQALENKDLPRSRLFKGMLYGTGKQVTSGRADDPVPGVMHGPLPPVRLQWRRPDRTGSFRLRPARPFPAGMRVPGQQCLCLAGVRLHGDRHALHKTVRERDRARRRGYSCPYDPGSKGPPDLRPVRDQCVRARDCRRRYRCRLRDPAAGGEVPARPDCESRVQGIAVRRHRHRAGYDPETDW